MRHSIWSAITCTALAASALLLSPAGASALQTVTSCNFTCTDNCILNSDLTCTNGQGITLQSGFDLDLNGHSLTCTSAVCGYKPGVFMSSSSSVVKSTATGSQGRILGPFNPAIDCNSQASSRVTGIRIEDPVFYATVNCAKVENNVFHGTQASFVYTTGVANTDRIGDNYFEEFPNVAMTVLGTKSVSVDHNLVVLEQETGYNPIGVELSVTSGAEITHNVFMGFNGNPISGTPAVADQNFCDPTGTDGQCQACIASGNCETPTAPFTMP